MSQSGVVHVKRRTINGCAMRTQSPQCGQNGRIVGDCRKLTTAVIRNVIIINFEPLLQFVSGQVRDTSHSLVVSVSWYFSFSSALLDRPQMDGSDLLINLNVSPVIQYPNFEFTVNRDNRRECRPKSHRFLLIYTNLVNYKKGRLHQGNLSQPSTIIKYKVKIS